VFAALVEKKHRHCLPCGAGLERSRRRDEIQTSADEFGSNAIKFTPEGGRIELEAQQVESEVQVKVRDNGPESRRRNKSASSMLFTVYGIRRGQEGTGLGWPSPRAW